MAFTLTTKHIWRLSPIVILTTILIGGCNSGSSTSTQAPSQSLSAELVFPALGDKVTGMTASLTIDGVGSFALTVNADNTVSATVPDIAPGVHNMTVTYSSADGLTLAEAKKAVDITATSPITVAYGPQDLNKNFDYDMDGWVNLAEILWGSAPTLYSSTPPGESPKFVVSAAGGEAVSTLYAVQSTLGEAVESQSTASGTYAMNGGFQSYR